jgi:beta,beta-carotene 9',10'-dioxygenase
MPIRAQLSDEFNISSLQVEGTIPSYLEGTLVRNGPVHVEKEGGPQIHWLDGLAMLHAFTLKEGKVSYANKFLRTDAYNKVFEEGSFDYEGFTMDPCKSLFKRFFTMFAKGEHIHNANVNVMKIANQYVAMTEVPLPVKFDKETLETIGVLDFDDNLPKDHAWESAHPHYDEKKGQYLNYLIDYGKTSYYVIYTVDQKRITREELCKIKVDEPSYMHTFAVTENYIIFTEFPLVVNPLNFIFKNKPFIYNFEWKKELGTKFKVISKKTGLIAKEVLTEPFFAFHHANAYEDKDHIIIDMVVYKNPSIILDVANHGFGDSLEEELDRSELKRFTLSLNEGVITSKILLSEHNEFPRINDDFDGRPYRYCYCTNALAPMLESDVRPIYKCDLKTQEVLRWSQKGCYPGEPIFVKDPKGSQEDDGVILNIVVDDTNRRSFLLILDAKNFKEHARVYVDHYIPFGLHGRFFSLEKS